MWEAHGNRQPTGDVGNCPLIQTLAKCRPMNSSIKCSKEKPSGNAGYGFPAQKIGATTLTEQWDPRQGSSWNHFVIEADVDE